MDFKSQKAIFVGYGEDQLGFRIWDPMDKMVNRSKDIIFNVKTFLAIPYSRNFRPRICVNVYKKEHWNKSIAYSHYNFS